MKNETNLRHVQLPNDMTKEKILTPQDILVYLAIKRYMNKNTKEAFPSLMTVSTQCGASINTIRKCINNLREAEYIDITKKGRQNIYTFKKYSNFEPFSYEFLDKQDLTFTEKAYLAVTQQYMFKENGEGKVTYSNKELSDKINMPISTISKCNRTLEKKEYLSIIKTNSKDPVTGLRINEKFFHLNELEQAIVFTLQNHEQRIAENTNEIETLKQQLETLKKDMKIILNENKEFKKDLNSNKLEL